MHNRALSKPAWSPKAFSRRVLISLRSLHIVVEGKSHDSAYYGLIAESSAVLAGDYEISRVDKIYTSGGKEGVLKVFETMRRSGHLIQASSAGPKVAVFMLDRDAEIVTGGTKRNPHIFYTRGYDVEADILMHGDTARALGATVGLSPADSRDLAERLGSWHQDAAHKWRDWVVLCCVATVLGIGSSANYSRGKVSDSDLRSIWSTRSKIKTASGMGDDEFEAFEGSIAKKIDAVYESGKCHTLVKGKWLPFYLRERVSDLFDPSECPDMNDFEKKVVSNFLLSLDPTRKWGQRYSKSWERLLC